jgi:small conductance mechanosensitive channel
MFEKAQLITFFDLHIVPWSLKVGVALTIFILGQIAAKIVSRALEKVLTHTKLDRILIDFLGCRLRSLGR